MRLSYPGHASGSRMSVSSCQKSQSAGRQIGHRKALQLAQTHEGFLRRPANESVGTGSSHPGLPAKSQGSASGSSNGSITSREAKGKQAAKGLTFNPLPKRASAKSSGLKAHPAAANGGTIGTPSSSVASSYNQQVGFLDCTLPGRFE